MWIVPWDPWTVNFVSCTINPCDVTIHALGKKKEARKHKLVNVDVYPNPAIIYVKLESSLQILFSWFNSTRRRSALHSKRGYNKIFPYYEQWICALCRNLKFLRLQLYGQSQLFLIGPKAQDWHMQSKL